MTGHTQRIATLERLRPHVIEVSRLSTKLAIGMSLRPTPDDGRLATGVLAEVVDGIQTELEVIGQILYEHEEAVERVDSEEE